MLNHFLTSDFDQESFMKEHNKHKNATNQQISMCEKSERNFFKKKSRSTAQNLAKGKPTLLFLELPSLIVSNPLHTTLKFQPQKTPPRNQNQIKTQPLWVLSSQLNWRTDTKNSQEDRKKTGNLQALLTVDREKFKGTVRGLHFNAWK